MAAEILPISTQDYFFQNYNPQETNLIPSFEINTLLTEDSYENLLFLFQIYHKITHYTL